MSDAQGSVVGDEPMVRKHKCKRVACVLTVVVLLAGLGFGGAALKHHQEKDSYPARCFVEMDLDDDDKEDLAEDVEENLEDVVEECEAQITALCGAAPAAAGLQDTLRWTACVSDQHYLLGTDCREAMADAGLLELAPFPPVLRTNRSLVKTATEACWRDARHECHDLTHRYDEENLCSVYEIALCLQDSDDVSAPCKEAIAELKLPVPEGYDVDDFQLNVYEVHGPNGLQVLFWLLCTVLLVKLGCKARRRYRRNAAASMTTITTATAASGMQPVLDAKTEDKMTV